jgi:tetratricopeptide (TPR) repeat protein
MKPYVNISVFEAGTAAARTLTHSIAIEGQTIASRNHSPVESQEVREISGQYRSLFEGGCKAEWAEDYFKTLGEGLFHLFFEDSWGQIKSRIDQGANIFINSEVPDVLGLPWELLRLPDGRVLGFDEGFSIRRQPKISRAPERQMPPGPLKVLFMACEPMDFDLEESSFLQGMEGLDILFEICDTCSFEELVRRAERLRPHLVHIVGTGGVKDDQANFTFQKDGMPELRSASVLGRALGSSGAQCIIFGGCQKESTLALDLLCQGIVGQIPLAIGWSMSSDFSQTLYRPLSSGDTIDAAMARARMEGRRMCAAQDKICALPFLYAASDQSLLFGERKTVEAHTIEELMPPEGLTDGYTEDFVDRRRDLARLIPAMREGSARAVVITGPYGAGKSTLATMLSSRLAGEGYRAVAVYSSQHNPISAVRILEAGIRALTGAGFTDDAGRLRDPAPLDQRMESMLDALDKGRFLLIIDGLAQSNETSKIDEPELARFYAHLLRNAEGTRAIVTANTLPADVMTLPRRAWEWELGGLPQAAFIRYLLQDKGVAEGYSKGLIDYVGLQRLYASAAGQPSCMAQMRKALCIGSENLNLNICDEFFSSLYSSLTSDSCLALARAAVYETAMNAVGWEAVTKEPEYEVAGMAGEWQRLSLAYPVGKLWAIPSHIRPWLLAHLSPEQLRDAHREAGIFLMDFANAGRSEEIRLSRLDCLMEARGHLLASGDLEQARLATTRISGFLERRGYYTEIIRQNKELLKQERHAGPMILIGRAYLDQGSYAKASEWFQRALESGPDAAACHGLGTAQFRQGKYDLARESFQKAVDICRISGDPQEEAAALHSLAAIDMEQNRNVEALEKLSKVLEIQERLGDLGGEAATIQDIAMLFMRKGDYASARQKLIESLKLLEQIGDDRGTASMLFNLASIDMNKGDYDIAGDEFRKALELKRKLGDRPGEAEILHSLGSIDMQRGDLDSSSENFLRALDIYQDLNDRRGEAGAFFQLGSVAIQNNRMHEGLKLMALANIILISIGSEDVKSVEPIVERFAAQLNYSQEQFMVMVREVTQSYRRDKGRSLAEGVFGKTE